MYVRQMQGADMRGREDLVAELTDHVEMIEDKLRSAAEGDARKEVYVELVEEDTAKAAVQIKQVSGAALRAAGDEVPGRARHLRRALACLRARSPESTFRRVSVECFAARYALSCLCMRDVKRSAHRRV